MEMWRVRNLCVATEQSTGADTGLPEFQSCMWNQLVSRLVCRPQRITRHARHIYCEDKGFDLSLVAFGRHSVNRTVVSLFKWLHMYN